MTRSLAILFAAIALAACSKARGTRDESAILSPTADSAVQFLITSAAKDFHIHRAQDPGRFRNVRVGHFAKAGWGDQYIMCGEFLPAPEGGKAEWTQFTTLKMLDYEQWIGPQPGGDCQRPAVTWDKDDLASTLQSRVDSLR